MQTAATLVGGDDVRLAVVVEAGAALVLHDISATLAHPGAASRMRVTARVETAAVLVYAEQPLVVAEGADLERRVTFDLAADARVLHRDTLVLGRYGESPGALVTRQRVERDGVRVLDETVDTRDPAIRASAAVLGDSRIVASLGLFGLAVPDVTDRAIPARGVFALGPGDAVVRCLGRSTRELSDLDALHRAWAAVVLDRAGRRRRPGAR